MHNHKHLLKEIAKFAAGLIAADFLVGLWLLTSGAGSLDIWGIPFTPSTVGAWMVFDIVVLAILTHYAWHADVHAPSPKQTALFVVIGILMGIIAVAHLLRLIFGVSVMIDGWVAPFWISGIGTIVALYLSYASFRFAAAAKT